MSLAFMRRLGAASGDLPDHVDVFPQSFECMGLDDLLTVSARIGDLAVTPAAEDDPVTPKDKIYQRGPVIDYHITVERAALIMDAAHAIMLDWPPSADRLFESVADRNPDPAPEHPVRRIFATRLGYHLLSPMRSVDGSDIRIIHGALEDWLHRERGIYLDGRRRPKVQAAGDILIDVADAIRRLEGRMINPSSLRFWADAGAIEMVGRKVRLSSVDRTVARLESLGVHEFHDPIPVEAWSGPSLYSDRYRRSDALRDLLSGRIRATRALPGEGQGLAGLMISRSDLVARIPERSGGQMRPLRVRLTAQEIRARRLSRRMKAALENDFFTNPARVHELIAALWPTVRPLNVVGEKVRCNYIVSEYGGRRCPRRLYSVADAIGLMTERHGPPVV